MAMVLESERTVEFSMVDLANIAYYPRIYDLAHRFFEATWPNICGQDYPHIIYQRRLGFPVINVESSFLKPLNYGDTIHARITITHLGNTSLTWRYRFSNQHGESVWDSTQTTVCVDMDSMDPQRIPDDIRQGLLVHLEGEETS
jgi:YbgC/YbaW family acyl-CoA thioester hydrolase